MRLTPAEVRALRTAFRDSPDLEKRLALGEWSALKLARWSPRAVTPSCTPR